MFRRALSSSTCELQASRQAGIIGSSLLPPQRRHIRRLHRYSKSRWKSLVKNKANIYSNKWELVSGMNFEKYEVIGHEREATENFARYRYDVSADKYRVYTRNMDSIPAGQRLRAIVEAISEKFRRSSNINGFEKAKMTLSALECYDDVWATGGYTCLEEMGAEHEGQFATLVEDLRVLVVNLARSNDAAVPMLIRAAQICSRVREDERRDAMMGCAEVLVQQMDRRYVFARPPTSFVPLIKNDPPQKPAWASELCPRRESPHYRNLARRGEIGERARSHQRRLSEDGD